MKLLHFLFLFLGLSIKISACQCPTVPPLSKFSLQGYEIIFKGKVISVVDCDNKPGVAVFKVLELYKGEATEFHKVTFNCSDPCHIKFSEGEEWIIYGTYRQIGSTMMDWCSRSRKYFNNEKLDFYAVNLGISYYDEVKFLQDSLGIYRLRKSTPSAENRNVLPNTTQSIVILISSLIALVLFYYIFDKVMK
ncbi:MAG: hypothetical protein AB7O73_07120 [Bacteroidia bacterium]